MAQGVIADSALKKAEKAGPDGTARLIVRLEDALLTAEEISALIDLGMVEHLPFFKQALVVLPGRCLLEVAELPSVVQVV